MTYCSCKNLLFCNWDEIWLKSCDFLSCTSSFVLALDIGKIAKIESLHHHRPETCLERAHLDPQGMTKNMVIWSFGMGKNNLEGLTMGKKISILKNHWLFFHFLPIQQGPWVWTSSMACIQRWSNRGGAGSMTWYDAVALRIEVTSSEWEQVITYTYIYIHNTDCIIRYYTLRDVNSADAKWSVDFDGVSLASVDDTAGMCSLCPNCTSM